MLYPLISIIVPVYNVESSLSCCVESIINQTYHNLEIILIDDGSKDDSGKICDKYALKDDRIIAIHTENTGVSTARNVGLQMANGEWIAFVDADDYLNCNYLDNLLQYRESDWIIGGYKTFGSKGKNCVVSLQREKESVCNLHTFVQKHLHRLYSTVPWGKLYRSKLIKENGLMFNSSIRLAEDMIFNLLYITVCRRISIVSAYDYNYYISDLSANRKYNLSVDEIENTISEINDAYNKIYSVLGLKFTESHSHSVAILLSMYPLQNIIQQVNDNSYLELYQKYFPYKNRNDFYNDFICSPILRFIHEIKGLYNQKKYNEGRMMMRKMSSIYGIGMMNVKTCMRIDSLIKFLLLHHMYNICDFFLIVYSKIR